MKLFFVKCGIVLFFSVNVIFIYWVNLPPAPVRTTLGSVAEKSADFSYRRVIVTNAILGERVGRFIRFKSTVEHRHDVILSLEDSDTSTDGCTVFSGYCYGIQDEPEEDCPFKSPFILIAFATPDR